MADKVLISANWLAEITRLTIDADVSSMDCFMRLLNIVGWPSPIEPLKTKSKKTRDNVPQNPKLSFFNKRKNFFTGL